MPHHTDKRVLCDCKLRHSNLVAISTRRAHRRKYGVCEGFIHHSSQLVDDLILDPESVDDAWRVENMLVDDILETIDQDWGNEEDDSDDKEYIDDDEEVEEDDIDEDSLMDEEDIEENVDEDLFMKDDISDAAGLVFAPGDLAEEISFLRSLSVLEPEGSMKRTMKVFGWKCGSNLSDTKYVELQRILEEEKVPIETLKTTRQYLQQMLGLQTRKYACCRAGCMAFTGENRKRRKCHHCHELQFIEPDGAFDEDLMLYPNFQSYANLKPRAVFTYIPIIPRLKLLYTNETYSMKMRYPTTLFAEDATMEHNEEQPTDDEKWEGIRDVWEGDVMKGLRIEGYFDDERTVALHFSTDGVRLFRSSKNEVWPFLLLNLNLDPRERYKAHNFLPLGLCPGPSSPKDLDSFLLPFIEELELLSHGVDAYDAHTKSRFLLKAHLVLITGDTPAVSKMLHLSGHNAKRPCRACHLEGTPYRNPAGRVTYYYPLQQPNEFPDYISGDTRALHARNRSYATSDVLPLRSKDDYQRDGEASALNPRLATSTGVKGLSPFARLPTISIPISSPFDVMHLVFLGLVGDLCDLFNGTYFKERKVNEDTGMLSNAQWITLGEEMTRIDAPGSYGRPPRNIQLYSGQFKAEDWSNFIIYYLLPLSYGLVNDAAYQALQRLVLAVSVATSYEINDNEIAELELNLRLFSNWFYDTFYGRKYERLPACKYTIHCLHHLAGDIRNWGSASYFWQFSQERLCGILVQSLKRRVHGSSNLSVIMHQHTLWSYGVMFGLISSPKLPSREEFQDPRYGAEYAFIGRHKSRHPLTRLQLNHLRQHYVTIHPETLDNIRHPDLINMDAHVQLYYRCRVEETIYHCESYQRSNSTRLNNLVCIEQEVDANARFRIGTRPEEMVRERFYAYVHFYCVHRFQGQINMLMYSSYRRTTTHHGLVEDHGRRHEGFQDIRVLEHLCARVIRQNGKTYFIDTRDVMEERLRDELPRPCS